MDANGDGTIDLEEWTTCMTKELRIAIYKSLSNKDKFDGFKPLVDVAKVQFSIYHFKLIQCIIILMRYLLHVNMVTNSA